MFLFKSEKMFDPTAVDDHQFKIKLPWRSSMYHVIMFLGFLTPPPLPMDGPLCNKCQSEIAWLLELIHYLLWIQPNWKYLEFLKENNDYLYGDLKLVFVQVWDIHFIGSGFSLWLLVWENFSIFYHQLLEIASTFLLYNFLGYAETAAMTSSNMQGRLVTWFFNFQLCVTLRELVKEWVSDSRSSFYQMLLISPI